jgi:hypothetical protein
MKKIVIETSYIVKERYFIEAESEQQAVDLFAAGNLKPFDSKDVSNDIVNVITVARWREARPPASVDLNYSSEHGTIQSNFYTVEDNKAVHHIGNTIIFD